MLNLGLKQTGSWGDALWLTCVCKARNDVVIEMHNNDEQCRQIARTFDYIARVNFVESPRERLYITNTESTHYAQRVLNSLGIDSVNCIPRVIVTDHEQNWARNFLSKYSNPVIIINDNSGSYDKTNVRAAYVRCPIQVMQYITDDLVKRNFDVLQFGRREDVKFTPLDGAIHIRGLSIRQQLACYKVVCRGIMQDTGDYHALLATGGKCICLHPPESSKLGYSFTELHYLPLLWKSEPVRVKYCHYHDVNKALEQFDELCGNPHF